jgi:DNA polymerase elongation subunit (family B)
MDGLHEEGLDGLDDPEVEEVVVCEEHEIEETVETVEPGPRRPTSPCLRLRERVYDLPAVAHGSECADGDGASQLVSIEAQIVDVTVRDYKLPSLDMSRPTMMHNPFFETYADKTLNTFATAIHVDVHLVDAAGRTVLCTIGGDSSGRPFTPRVSFLMRDASKDRVIATKALVDAIAEHCRVDKQALEASKLEIMQTRLVGFDPAGGDPTSRRKHAVVSLGFSTLEQARRARYATVDQLGFQVLDPRCDASVAFLVERKISACGWVHISNARKVLSTARVSAAQLELRCGIEAMTPSARRGLAPLLVASYDIETYGSRGAGVFPDANLPGDYICAISTNFMRAGGAADDQFSVVMIVGSNDAHHGHDTAIECFANEKDMLMRWSELIRLSGASIVTGYNIFGFDNPYVATRAKLLEARMFWHGLGMFLCEPAEEKEFKLESAAFGQNEGVTLALKGRVIIDMMQYLKMNYQLPLYSLDHVSQHFLGERKYDLDIPTMWRLVEQGDFGRVIPYVKIDALNVNKLLRNRDAINSVWEMSRATSTLPTDILTRGQQIRVTNLLRRKCAERGVALTQTPACAKRKFIGARVVSPQSGFYDPNAGRVITLDFASLYPSIVRAYNLCYQTWIEPQQVQSVRARFPQMEIVEVVLELGQVWEPVRHSEVIAGDMTEFHSKELVSIGRKQLKKDYAEIALTHDEFQAAVRIPLSGAALTARHFVRIEAESAAAQTTAAQTSAPRFLFFRPKHVAHHFAKGVPAAGGGEERCPSLLPEILAELGTLRKKAKKAMAAAEAEAAAQNGAAAVTATQLAALYDKEQLAYKVVMNSVYGYTAANTLRLLALAESITALGRRALGDSITIAKRVTAEMGFSASDVVYGDTDSIFVHVSGASREEALDVGARISEECNAFFARATQSSVLKLEFEALFEGLILVGKKCYAGLQYAVVEHNVTRTVRYNDSDYAIAHHGVAPKPKKYKKGMRAVRRDTPLYVRRIQGESIDILLETRSVEAVLRYLEQQLQRLFDLEVPMSDFSITMKLKREEDYARRPGEEVAAQAHLRLVRKLKERAQNGGLPQGCTIWATGDRVPFYYAESNALLACDRAECPVYGKSRDIPPDRVHYFDLTKSALEQGLGVVPEVKRLVERFECTRASQMRAATKSARAEVKKQANREAERRRLQEQGQRSISGFLKAPGASPSASNSSSSVRVHSGGKRVAPETQTVTTQPTVKAARPATIRSKQQQGIARFLQKLQE